MTPGKRRDFIAPLGYLTIIAVVMIFAFPMESDNSNSFFLLMTLTLPWSIATFFVIMAAIHMGSSNEVGSIAIAITALLNAWLIYLFSRRLKR